MKYYLAPLEGITTYIYRNAYHSMFQPMDKYFTPFIVPRMNKSMNSRERNDILPEHNEGLFVVPQLLTNCAEDFIRAAHKLAEYGYEEINLNLGCPSGTVVAKHKGSGFLAQPQELERFLDEIFSRLEFRISIKTRIGIDHPEEFEYLLEIYNKFPLEELIIHPRVQKDFYKNKPNLSVFKDALRKSKNPVCYNGDIFTEKDYERLTEEISDLATLMLGRGIIRNPGLLCEFSRDLQVSQWETKVSQTDSGKQVKNDRIAEKERYEKAVKNARQRAETVTGTGKELDWVEEQKQKITLGQLQEFHTKIYTGYQETISGERNVLFKMKELWSYMIQPFTDCEKYAKKIRKAETFRNYEIAVNALFREQTVVDGLGKNGIEVYRK